MNEPISIFWFRRDLRLEDNAGLFRALKDRNPVLPLFIFDSNILDQLEDREDSRVTFIYNAVKRMHEQLIALGSSLEIRIGRPEAVFRELLGTYRIRKVITNHDYEPYAADRDHAVNQLLKTSDVGFETFKDQVIFDRDEIVKDDGSPYTVYTPYSKRWLAKLNDFYLRPYPTEKYFSNFMKIAALPFPALREIGFSKGKLMPPPATPDLHLLQHYAEQRNFPGENATSRMGIHLRFGTISIRKLAASAQRLSAIYLNELIWREFYMMILWHFPQVGRGRTFKPAYEHIPWRNDENEFERWCAGKTGYPIVDAGMRQLNATGFMHNRVRMIVASFLAKHLLIDWRWGEAYFAAKLLDYDLAANNGGWQWAVGSGCDAAPYFRIFNPTLQVKKFDPQLKYVRTWVPELDSFDYPQPIVEHEYARKRCLEVYSKALNRAL